MKRKCKEEVEVKYKGVYQTKSGKFGAAISDPKRSHGTIWLGSFTSATEAAKAYDKAAIKLRGSQAILNFPLPSGISSEESTKTETTNTFVSRGVERTKDVTKTVGVVKTMEGKVNRDEDSKVHDHSRVPGSRDSTEEPNSKVDLMKRKYEEVQVSYKGVYPTKSGKFGAVISDPKRSHGTIWLGSFISATEAAKAYDKAAFKLRGSKAILNFPLSSGISPEESTKTETTNTSVRPSQERTKDVTKMVGVVKTMEGKYNRDEESKVHNHSRPSSPLFLHWSGLSSSRQSQSPVGSSENGKGEKFNWTDESLVLMCDILNKHLAKNGRNSPFIWEDHMLEFQKISHHKFSTLLAFRRKYWEMKQSYILWKSLKKSKNGSRWDKRTGKLDCSNDWWERKIRENPKYMMLRKKQPSKELQEAWDQLFGNVGRKPSNQIQYMKDDDDDDENVDDDDDDDDDGDGDGDGDGDESASEHTLPSSQFGNQGTEKATPFTNETRQEDILTPNQNGTRFKAFVAYQNGNPSISAAMSVINRMVGEGLMVSCSELWCFAISLCEDEVKRALFLSLPDDDGRLAWLQYKQDNTC